MNVVIALCLIALGMCIDAYYQSRIRIAECDAYETGYQQGKKEEDIRIEVWTKLVGEYLPVDAPKPPSMEAPVSMPDTFEERMRKHGRAVVKLK